MRDLNRLADCLLAERDAILVRWRDQVRALPSAKGLDLPTLNDHMPIWIVEMVAMLRAPLRAGDQAQRHSGGFERPGRPIRRDGVSQRGDEVLRS